VVVALVASSGDTGVLGTSGGDAVDSAVPVTLAPVDYRPELVAAPCERSVAEAVSGAACGNLMVPESRDDPDGPQLALPVVHLAGGSSTVDPVVLFDINEPVARTSLNAAADVYALQARGFGRGAAGASMVCEGIPPVWTAALAVRADDPGTIDRKAAAAGKCADRLRAKGVALYRYTQKDLALDLRDLLVALDLDRVTIAAGGYTTPAVVAFTRAHPDAVAALLLTNPTPPGKSPLEKPAVSLSKQFDRLIALCEADEACAADFPDLENQYRLRYEQLAATPEAVTTKSLDGQGPYDVALDGRRFAAALQAGLQSSSQVGLLPSALLGASSELIAAAALNWDVSVYIAQDDRAAPYLALTCSYDLEPSQTASVSDVTLAQFAGANDAAFKPVCDAFDVPSVFDDLSHPLMSDVPVLFATGGLSISGVNGWAEEMAPMLGTATVVDFPTMSEDLPYSPPPCLRDLRKDFVIDPTAKIDQKRIDKCEKESPPVEFVAPN